MQLKLKRTQRDGGIVSKSVVFCLDARVEFEPEEKARIVRYKLHKQVIYNSEAAQKHLASAGMAAATGSVVGGLKSLGSLAFAAMNLNISIESLERGQHVECKSMDELLGAEDAVITACRNLKGYLDTAATFDGREVLVDFADDEPQVVVSSVAPVAQLVAPGPAPTLATPAAPAGRDDAAAAPPPPAAAAPYDFGTPQSPIEAWGKKLRNAWDRSPARVIITAFVIVFVVLLIMRTCSSFSNPAM